jgi:hypothetical protein
MEPWLIATLIERGILQIDGVNRRARLRACPRCRAVCLEGLDDDRCAGMARVDPVPLSVLGEVAALMDGLATYELHTPGGRLTLDYRDSWCVQARPAGNTLRVDVMAQHRCGRRSQGICASMLQKAYGITDVQDVPPF